MRRIAAVMGTAASLLVGHAALGQLDPERREMLQFGFDRSLEGAEPLEGYGFYYLNEPNYFRTNITLRLAVAPVYVDSETGFVGLLGPHTDFGLGLAGGGFADDYYEFHDGKYQPGESFFGHSFEASASIYHLFNPGQRIPLYGIFRIKEHYSIYSRDQTSSGFDLPPDHSTIAWRMGLRWGGREPLLEPDVAMEMSAWYEGQYRTESGGYGFDGDRDLEESSHLFWARALLIYTLPNSKQSFDLNLTAGGIVQPDRFSAFRLGGTLPLATEFPLVIPGYFDSELSARDFACFTAQYTFPLDAAKRWTLEPIGSLATVDYIPGLAQQGHFNSGVGMGLGYRSKSNAWRAVASYGYGFEAIRSEGRGSQSVSVFIEINLGARHPGGPSGLDHITSFFLNHF